jgi:hypothetical protein
MVYLSTRKHEKPKKKNILMNSVMKLYNMNVDVWWDKRDIDNDISFGFMRSTMSDIFYS